QLGLLIPQLTLQILALINQRNPLPATVNAVIQIAAKLLFATKQLRDLAEDFLFPRLMILVATRPLRRDSFQQLSSLVLELLHHVDERNAIDSTRQLVKLTSRFGRIKTAELLNLVKANRENVVVNRLINASEQSLEIVGTVLMPLRGDD